jgi:hypothetical protein
MGWLRLTRRTDDPGATDAWKITGFYCSIPCLAIDVNRLMERLEAASIDGG